MSNSSDNDYFSDGITEEIINALNSVKGLKVIARTSSFAFKGKNIDVRKIGKQLEVHNILEGSVRMVQNHVRITAQLIDAETGVHYWSKNFDRELNDIFKLQDEVSLLIANQIRENFGHLEIQEHLVKQPTTSFTAYELFLKGRYQQLQWTPDSMKKAIAFFDMAIAQDKNFARAYYGNLQCYGLLAIWGYMEHETAMEKAIGNLMIAKEIDASLPEYPLAFVGRSFWGEWDFKAAYGYIQQTLGVNQNHIDGLEAMAEMFIALGFFEEATVYAKKLLGVDPLSANNLYTYAHILYYQRNYKEALQWVQKSLEVRPDLELSKHLLVLCYIQLKDKDAFERAIMNDPLADLQLLLYHAVNDTVELTDDTLTQWMDTDKSEVQLAPYELYIMASAGYKKHAFILLKKYIDQRRGQIINYRQEVLLENLHGVEGFHELHVSNLLRIDLLPGDRGEPEVSVKNRMDSNELTVMKQVLIAYIEKEKPYLDTQLSLTGLGNELNMQSNKLSYMINEVLGINFNEFINRYRLEHFKSIAALPENKSLTLVGLAYESGFNSKSVFNTYFKKVEGVTPKVWLKGILET
ncbi:hypothetical protein NBRC110019_15270 [Neptunitalea chrysea]|uniref:HTH araC/xylS-type domain-containing protein n=2 Tax=Neptunitalea chrysea TaxID=1647581 RepID=A0A9W6B606_9FLAO|nr:hypothetical protein NBRC110019_15270 [Neptunitalea chrysea]